MCVVNDGDEHSAGSVKAERFLDKEAFAFTVAAVELDLKGFAEDAQGVVIGVECAIDDGRDHALLVMGDKGVLEHALAGAGFAQDEAQAALLGMDAEDVEDLLLVSEQGYGFGFEGIASEPEV